MGGDDVAEHDAANDRIVVRLGTGASATAGGAIGVGKTYALVLDVIVNAPVPAAANATTITNTATATATFNSQTLDTALTATSSATTTVAGPDLAVTKTHTGSLVLGADVTYTIGVSNVGPAASQGLVTISDTLPTGLPYVSATGTGWSCSQSAGTVTCTRSDALTAKVADSASAMVANTVGSRTGVTALLTTVKARTFTLRLVSTSRVPGTGLRKGAVLAQGVSRVAAGRHVIRLTARSGAAAALRAGRVDRATLVLVARSGSRSVRVITVC